MKVSIVFHSVSGNVYLMAKEIQDNLMSLGIESKMLRVYDEDLEKLSNEMEVIKEFYEEISNIPIVTLEDILESDYVFMGTPTYFGNVSAELKVFMDSFAPLWAESKLFGKNLISFASCGTINGGGEQALYAVNTFGQHMGMRTVSIPSTIYTDKYNCAYGMLHCCGGNGDKRIDEEGKKYIKDVVKKIFT